MNSSPRAVTVRYQKRSSSNQFGRTPECDTSGLVFVPEELLGTLVVGRAERGACLLRKTWSRDKEAHQYGREHLMTDSIRTR